MTCPAIQTGQDFLATALAHIDCQAQTIGSYGFAALADPGSVIAQALASILTIFVAIFGVRLLLGYPQSGRDLVGDVVKVAIVLTLATSWPAWRVLGYDIVIHGPDEVARTIGMAAQLPGSGGDLSSRLQKIDDGLAALNSLGSGRLGVANGDWFQLGFARSAFLTGTLAPMALVRLTAGILLAIAPLVAGLLLFGITRPIIAGWARGLVAAFLASMALTLVLFAELALIEPWLQDALLRRSAEEQVLDAPVEILVVTLVFALVSFGVTAFTARMAFHPSGWITVMVPSLANANPRGLANPALPLGRPADDDNVTRARSVAMAVSETIHREERMTNPARGAVPAGPAAALPGAASSEAQAGRPDTLGSSYRRNSRRISATGARRDRPQ